MNLLRSLLGLAVGIGFLALLAVLAWYIVIPLFFVFALIALVSTVRARFMEDKLKVFDISTPLEDEKPKKQVIDVDYTEI